MFAETELNIHHPVHVAPTTIATKKQSLQASSSRNKIPKINSRSKGVTETKLQDNHPLPTFENTSNTVTNVTAQQGSIAVLPCHIRNLGDRPVRTLNCVGIVKEEKIIVAKFARNTL